VTNSGIIKFTNWISERATFSVNIETPLAGLDVNSFLGRGSDKIRSYGLRIAFTSSYFVCKDQKRMFTLPYALSLRELHCGCCKWDSNVVQPHHASARASSDLGTLAEYSTFLTTSKAVIQSLLVPQSCICKHELGANFASTTVRSANCLLNAGATTTVWCGIWKNDNPLIARARFSPSSAIDSVKHTEIMKREDVHCYPTAATMLTSFFLLTSRRGRLDYICAL
jgi:hypothetical protein